MSWLWEYKMNGRAWFVSVAALILMSVVVSEAQDVSVAELVRQEWFPKAPPLAKPKGEVIRVSNPEQFRLALNDVKAGGTILLEEE